MIATFLLLYYSIAFTLCVHVEGGRSKVPLLHFGSSVFRVNQASFSSKSLWCLYPSLHCIICIFLIHSDILQRMLTALFKLVWNTQKTTCTIFLSTKSRCFLILKIFWCLNALPYCFFLRIFEGVKFLLTYKLRNITKTKWH